MADRKNTIPPADGETRLGATLPGAQGGLYVQSGNAASLGSWLALDGVDSNGAATTWYLFVTSAGVLRISSTIPTNTESDGSAV